MGKQDKYHPSLFAKASETTLNEQQEPVIPQSTLYDIPIQSQTAPIKKHVIIFGFSQQNRQSILEQIEKTTKLFRKEEGKNYIIVWSEDNASLDALLKFNHKIVNGEIIGAYRKSFGAVDDPNIYLKKKGLFNKVYEYFFGE
ncbi:hypothetical protein GINT2_002028 [Glugoides intestinalis]